MINSIYGVATEKTVESHNRRFRVRLITKPSERLERSRRITVLTGGAPLDSITDEDYSLAIIVSTLDLCVDEYNPGSNGGSEFKENEKSWVHCENEELMLDLYRAYKELEVSLEEAKKKSQSQT